MIVRNPAIINYKLSIITLNPKTLTNDLVSNYLQIPSSSISNFNSVKTQQSASNQHNQQLKHHLQLVFIYYSSFADRNNYHLLKQQNYRRFLIDSEIVKSATDFPQFDIMFKKVSKGNSNAVNFQQFLKLLPQIAYSRYREQSRQAAFKKLIINDIKKLQTQIRQHSQFGQQVNIVQNFLSRPQMQKQQEVIIKKLTESCMMKKCYQVYICSTSMHQKCPSDTFESFYKFLKQFQISPQLIYKTICFVAFIILLMSKNQGTRQQFDLETFVKMVLVLAEIITTKELSTYNSDSPHTQIQQSKTDRICRVLQRMQISTGFQKISRLIKGETYYSMSLVRLVAGQGLSPFKTKESNVNGNDQFSTSGEKNSYSMRYRQYLTQIYNEKPSFSSYQSLNTLANEPQQFRLMKKIFQDLCSFGEVGNTKTLKSLKIKKLFNQIGLLKVVTQAWLDLTIAELVRRSSTGKMEFIQFVELLNQTAKKMSIPQSQVYNIIITNAKQLAQQNITDLGSLTTSSIAHYDEKDMALCMEMLETISFPLEKIFHFYSKSKNYISFSELSKLMYDFEVFPSVINKAKLFSVFCQCYDQSIDTIALNDTMKNPDIFLKDKYMSKKSNKYATTQPLKLNGDPHLRQEKLMHISTFPLLLLKTSNEICEQSLSGPQKLIILLQKMHESKGQQKVVIGKGSLVSELRRNYPQIYKMSFGGKDQKVRQENIEDLLDNISQY